MEIIAETKTTRITPRKVRLVADAVRRKSAKQAVTILSMTNKHGAYVLLKTLKSAMANAVQNGKLIEDNLVVERLEINEGPFLKRFKASTRGRIHPFKKRSSHIRVVLKEKGAMKV